MRAQVDIGRLKEVVTVGVDAANPIPLMAGRAAERCHRRCQWLRRGRLRGTHKPGQLRPLLGGQRVGRPGSTSLGQTPGRGRADAHQVDSVLLRLMTPVAGKPAVVLLAGPSEVCIDQKRLAAVACCRLWRVCIA